MRLNFDDIPVFCAHEHWGSFAAYGVTTEGFRADVECGAAPTRAVSLWDLILDPYFGGWLYSSGADLNKWAVDAGASDFHEWAQKRPADACNALLPVLARHRLTGGYQVLRQGILRLYKKDLDDLSVNAAAEISLSVAQNYQKPIDWITRAACQEKLGPIVRPVHPEFYLRKGPYAAQEAAAISTLLRIDPLLELWQRECPRREALGNAVGVVPCDAASWRAFLSALFDLAAANGAVGIKQLQAYTRDLDFVPRKDDEISWPGSELSAEQVRAFQDWVVLECCRLAQERNWPFQFHIGTHNLSQSSPMPLASLAQRFPKLKIVLLHCWPFIDEAGWLAKHFPNVYIDGCWQVVLNPMFLERSLRTWLSYVPASKLMFSQDATSVEMAVGAAALVRWILARALENHAEIYGTERKYLEQAARWILYENGAGLYSLRGRW